MGKNRDDIIIDWARLGDRYYWRNLLVAVIALRAFDISKVHLQ